MEIERSEHMDAVGKRHLSAKWTAREGVGVEVFTSGHGSLVAIETGGLAGLRASAYVGAQGRDIEQCLEFGILLGRAMSATLDTDALAAAVESARTSALKAESEPDDDEDEDSAACVGCDELMPRDDLTETSAGDRMCADCIEASDECSTCRGSGIGQHGDPDTSRCLDCRPSASRDSLEAADYWRDQQKDGAF